MSRSVIQDVYDAISELQLELNDKLLNCTAPSALPNTITTAHLPLRILTPLSRWNTTYVVAPNTFNPSQGSTVNQLFWTITELFLLTPVAQGSGVRFQNDLLVEYCAEYFQKLSEGNLALPDNTWLENVTFRPDVIEYPLGSSSFYFGVIGTFTISEKIP